MRCARRAEGRKDVESLYLLIPLSAMLVLIIIAVFGWAVHRGQFEELDAEAERILSDETHHPDTGLDGRQGKTSTRAEES